MKIRGVNLGNWLVLEKWMSPGLFAGTEAEDEYYLAHDLPKERYEERIATHRAEYITERDFAMIRRFGMNSVRIPVPYFIFGDRPPFIGCIEELDKAFAWAEKFGIKILIDLHTTPGSQNGLDNGGITGVCKWSQNPQEVEFVLNVLEKLAERYGKREGLLGIQPVNEPMTERTWNMMDMGNRYPARDPEMAEGSAPVSMDFLRQFYLDAYERIRRHTDKTVVYHDGFELKSWRDFFENHPFENVMLDTHLYLMMAELMGCKQTINGYIEYIQDHYAKDIAEIQEYIPVICGEWCLFNSMAVGHDTKGGQTELNGMTVETVETLSDTAKQHIYQQIANAQLAAWDCGSGYFYWSYKLLLDVACSPSWSGWEPWDLGRSVAMNWFPYVGENNREEE